MFVSCRNILNRAVFTNTLCYENDPIGQCIGMVGDIRAFLAAMRRHPKDEWFTCTKMFGVNGEILFEYEQLRNKRDDAKVRTSLIVAYHDDKDSEKNRKTVREAMAVLLKE